MQLVIASLASSRIVESNWQLKKKKKKKIVSFVLVVVE
jgi:hypothetical protein